MRTWLRRPCCGCSPGRGRVLGADRVGWLSLGPGCGPQGTIDPALILPGVPAPATVVGGVCELGLGLPVVRNAVCCSALHGPLEGETQCVDVDAAFSQDQGFKPGTSVKPLG